MGSVTPRNIRSFTAGGAITAFTFVKFDSDGVKVVACGANERAIGIAQVAASASGDQVEVAMPGGGGKLKINETLTAGKMLTSTAGALGEKADAAGEWVGAIAYEGGVQNDIIETMVTGFQAVADDT